MIITSGQGITPKQLEENSVIRRAESHKINTTFKVPTFFQDASGGAYMYDSSSYDAYVDGKKIYSSGYQHHDYEDVIQHAPQLIKTQRTKLIPTEIDDAEKMIIKSFSFTSTFPLKYHYYDSKSQTHYVFWAGNTSSISNAYGYSKKFDDIRNCTLPDNLTIEKDGIYLTEQYVCIKAYVSKYNYGAEGYKELTSEEVTAIKNGTFEMSFTCNFGISFIEFK